MIDSHHHGVFKDRRDFNSAPLYELCTCFIFRNDLCNNMKVSKLSHYLSRTSCSTSGLYGPKLFTTTFLLSVRHKHTTLCFISRMCSYSLTVVSSNKPSEKIFCLIVSAGVQQLCAHSQQTTYNYFFFARNTSDQPTQHVIRPADPCRAAFKT